ncbi:hypothetical protein MRB53_009937 [Persea americana]|uniref:Uncharacterized protein n=1 Tax=Persea americana TaxID=3435 RepID=A0ACC2LQE5_PERAE|nr:hypothetical protein MRB53_009937 [Persea americana]
MEIEHIRDAAECGASATEPSQQKQQMTNDTENSGVKRSSPLSQNSPRTDEASLTNLHSTASTHDGRKRPAKADSETVSNWNGTPVLSYPDSMTAQSRRHPFLLD